MVAFVKLSTVRFLRYVFAHRLHANTVFIFVRRNIDRIINAKIWGFFCLMLSVNNTG